MRVVPLPDWLEPMKATLTRERFEGAEWVFERKLDGIRLLAYKKGPAVRLLTRNKLVRNESYPAIAEADAWSDLHEHAQSLSAPLERLQSMLTEADWREAHAATTRRPRTRKGPRAS